MHTLRLCAAFAASLSLLAPLAARADAGPLPEIYEVTIRCFKGEKLYMETQVQTYGGGFDATIQSSQPIVGSNGEALEHPASIILIDSSGPLAGNPDVSHQSPAVAAAVGAASLARLGPLNFWFYCPGADRYEIEVSQEVINPADWVEKADAPYGWQRVDNQHVGPFEQIGTLKGSLPTFTDIGNFPAQKPGVMVLDGEGQPRP